MEMRKKLLICAGYLFLLPKCHAAIELTAAVGPDWLNGNNTHIVNSAFETDKVLVNQFANTAQWQMGVGYPIFESYFEKYHFLNQLLLALNLYHTQGSLKGNVWQFGMPEFNNYNFNAPFTSTRLMLDLKPRLFTYKTFSPYFIAGIGVASNTLGYNETVTGAGVDPSSALSLGKEQQYQFAYEVGLGLRTTITQHLSASIEYLYASLGNSNSPADDPGAVRLAEVPTFLIRSQSGLFGLTWTF